MFFLTYTYDNGVGQITDSVEGPYADDDTATMLHDLTSYTGSPRITSITDDDFEDMLRGAVTAALFTAHVYEPGDDDPDDALGNGPTGGDARRFYDRGDFDTDDLSDFLRDDLSGWVCSAPVKIRTALDYLGTSTRACERLGELWLYSCQGHGTGLWDADLPDRLGDELHELTGNLGSVVVDARGDDAAILSLDFL